MRPGDVVGHRLSPLSQLVLSVARSSTRMRRGPVERLDVLVRPRSYPQVVVFRKLRGSDIADWNSSVVNTEEVPRWEAS